MRLRHTPEDEKGMTGNTGGESGPARVLRVNKVLAHKVKSLCQSPFFVPFFKSMFFYALRFYFRSR
jgi:hypothetical protein